ncbi:hypothetical protein BJ170DRAFT_703728 [Xylariales sp. AK1849]|nr:hypothetical protein BJ170DRAFT_703728 [Xylariales sp. AK1849]
MRSIILLSSLLAITTPTAAFVTGPPQRESRYRSVSEALGLPHREPAPRLVPIQNYHNEVVLRFDISSAEHEAAFRQAADRMFLDIWDFTSNYTDIRIPKSRIRPFLNLLPELMRSEQHMVLIPDVAGAVAATYPNPTTSRGDTELELALRQRGVTERTDYKHKNRGQDVNNLFFKDYQRMSVIASWMRLIDSMFRPSGLVRKFSIGKSYEGRDIPALRIGLNTDADGTKPRKTILVTGGLHAREWISTSTANYVAWSFITSFNDDPLATKILNEFDIVFVPVLNPDGYEYTWNVDRLWRKSRQRTPMHLCTGFDLDHSFGYRWDTAEHQKEPCSESYGGDKPFQAVEASQLAEWAKNETEHNVDFVAYLDLHSYSQQILWPYAYSCGAKVPNLENMQEVAMNIAKTMRLSNGEAYTVGSACEGAVAGQPSFDEHSLSAQKHRVEAAGGSAIDYFHHDLKARYSYQIKLRDTGSYGFLLPSDDIVPVGQEVFAALRYVGDYLLGNNGIERSKDVADAETQKGGIIVISLSDTWDLDGLMYTS